MKPLISLSALVVFLGLAANAQAQDPMRYEIMQRHLANQPAMLRILANAPLQNIEVNVTNCGPDAVKQSIASMAKGEVQVIQWNQPAGKYNCTVNIHGKAGAGTWSVLNNHEFLSLSPLQLSVDLRELSPESNSIMLHASAPMVKASITVRDTDGATIDTVEKAVDKKKDFLLSWTPNGKSPALLDIRIDDGNGAWATNTVFYIQIPHTDIVFETNSADIRDTQEPYLRDSLQKIMDVTAKYSQVAIDLYITGHTDTVGSAQDNERLSLKRAKAIATWFRSNGVSFSIYYRGAGERGLAVATPDNTPNEQNRRAVYILSNHAPVEAVSLGQWTKL